MNIYLVALLLLGIIIFSNLITYAAVRGSRGMKMHGFNLKKNGLNQTFEKENQNLDELHQHVEALSQKDEDE